MDGLEPELRTILDEVAPGKEYVLTAHLEEDLGLDSLDQINLFFLVEQKFQIKIPDELLEAGGLSTLSDLNDFVRAESQG